MQFCFFINILVNQGMLVCKIVFPYWVLSLPFTIGHNTNIHLTVCNYYYYDKLYIFIHKRRIPYQKSIYALFSLLINSDKSIGKESWWISLLILVYISYDPLKYTNPSRPLGHRRSVHDGPEVLDDTNYVGISMIWRSYAL